MWVCDLLKSSTTFASTGSWVLSSPVPRQQYHLISTGGPLGAAVPLAAPLEVELPPLLQAVMKIAKAMTTAERAGVVLRIGLPRTRVADLFDTDRPLREGPDPGDDVLVLPPSFSGQRRRTGCRPATIGSGSPGCQLERTTTRST